MQEELVKLDISMQENGEQMKNATLNVKKIEFRMNQLESELSKYISLADFCFEKDVKLARRRAEVLKLMGKFDDGSRPCLNENCPIKKVSPDQFDKKTCKFHPGHDSRDGMAFYWSCCSASGEGAVGCVPAFHKFY